MHAIVLCLHQPYRSVQKNMCVFCCWPESLETHRNIADKRRLNWVTRTMHLPLQTPFAVTAWHIKPLHRYVAEGKVVDMQKQNCKVLEIVPGFLFHECLPVLNSSLQVFLKPLNFILFLQQTKLPFSWQQLAPVILVDGHGQFMIIMMLKA